MKMEPLSQLIHFGDSTPEQDRLADAAADLLKVCERWDEYRVALLLKEFDANSISLRMLLDETRAAIAKATPKQK